MTAFIEFISSASSSTSGSLRLTGDWTIDNVAAIDREWRQLSSEKKSSSISSDINSLDTAGAALLFEISKKNKIQDLSEPHRKLLELIGKHDTELPKDEPPPSQIIQFLQFVGKNSLEAWESTKDLIEFIGETTVNLWHVILHPSRLRFTSTMRHIKETGLQAVPIVSLIAFLISIVLAYQGATQLRRFGAEIFTINMVAISVLREMGVLLTAIMIAGRSGSAFTAEIGVMQVNEEVDAMRVIGVNPFEVLVLPRVIALIIAMPLLTFIADIMGLIGGGLISYSLMDIGYEHYLDRFKSAVDESDFFVGLVKAPVFAFFIAIVGCMRGMQVTGSAESVGRLTTTSVVQSIFLVLLLDALFSILFTKLGV